VLTLQRPLSARYLFCLTDPTSPSPQVVVPRIPRSRRFFRRVKGLYFRSSALYRAYLKHEIGASSLSEAPGPHLMNATLKTRAEWTAAQDSGRKRHSPLLAGAKKNGHHPAAITTIVENTSRDARNLDGGAEIYSNVLPALFPYGLRELYGINLSF